MKNTKTLLALLGGALVSTAAYAQVEVTITGSTAFRSIVIDRVANGIYDAGSLSTFTFDASAGTISYSGTMSNKTSLGTTPVKIHLAFLGSASGMLAVKNHTPVNTANETAGGTPLVPKFPDLALSDVFPGSATPSIPATAFDPENKNYLGVIPFVYVRNNAMPGITNITRQQALLLMNGSGDGGATIGFLDGNPAHTGNIYMTGRDSGSGTRISVEKCLRWTGTPLLWGTNDSSGTYFTFPDFQGYTSGAFERGLIAFKADAIGYLGRADAGNIAASASQISFNGIAYSTAAVENGSYELWGYEHMYNLPSLSANQRQVRTALFNAITDATYQGTPIYTGQFEPLTGMLVERGDDGANIRLK